jgi:amino acid adenylation domain-containing protein
MNLSMDTTSSTILDQFHRQVESTPDALAIVFEEGELSFGQLDHLASQFAASLISAGVEAGDTVGLCIDRCPEAIAAMIGAFKISAVYVPLDPEYPLDRVRYMIDDADLKAIITHDLDNNPLAVKLQAAEAEGPRRTIRWIDSHSDSFRATAPATSFRLPQPDDLAYIMYTSGSTGMPKGVQIEHRALRTYCDADRAIYELTPSDRTLQFSTLNFDIAIEEIFPPLLAGGSVVIRPRHRASANNELSWIIEQYNVTAIHIATAYWHEWVDLMVATGAKVPGSLRLVIATGEKISVEHYRRWKGICDHRVMWCNAYGPTETTVTCTVFIPDEHFCDEHMPIGKPLPGYQAYILNDANQPLGIGETGHLFIGGPALARGYHNNPAKTEAAFLTVELPETGRTRIYRTGDLARWLPTGDIEFAGRVDHQIKVGSYRIEPGEIEVAIAKFPGVLESIVIHEQIESQKFLIAYIATGGATIDLASLQTYLRTQLPAYMIPPRYVLLAALPKTINGKIDRRSLPSPSTSQSVQEHSPEEPCTQLEARLVDIWKSVLHLPQIGIHDDFFLLGGSSLLVTRVVAALATQLQIELPVRDFFANPTISSIAAHIEHLLAAKEGRTAAPTTQARLDQRKRLPKIHACMLAAEQGSIFTVRYEPVARRRNHSVLICNAIGHEQIRAYRNLQQLAIRLCEQGFDVLRFDYRGTGNSSEPCEQLSAESMQIDTEIAASHLREVTSTKRLSLVGIRLGATVAANAHIADVDQCLFWDPIFDGTQFIEQLDQFHWQSLTNQTRFARRMKPTDNDQAYGHAMTQSKRSSLSSLRMPTTMADHCHQATILMSSGYRAAQSNSGEIAGANIIELADEIDWYQVAFAESAFSSPYAYAEIERVLISAKKDEPIPTVEAIPTFDLRSYSPGLNV